MVYEHKTQSMIKTVPIASVTVPAGHALDKHGIVFVGDRVGVVMEKVDDVSATVCFDTQTEFVTTLFDESAVPRIGEKIYAAASDGKLTKTASGNKLVGYYWGKFGNSVIFSLGM